MKNVVLEENTAGSEPIATRSVERALAARRAAYEDEVRRLVGAAFALIAETGQLEPRVADVVLRAGLSNQAFYRHFRSKDELLLAVLDAGIRMLAEYLGDRMTTSSSPAERVVRWVEGMTRQALRPEAAAATRPFAVSRARLSERFPSEVARSETQLTALLRDALRDAAAAGELPHVDADRDARALYDLSMGWLQRRLAQTGPVDPDDAAHLVAFAMHGLRREG